MVGIKSKAIYYVKFLGEGFFFPLFTVYLTTLNFTGGQIGEILFFTAFMGLLVNPLWRLLAGNNKVVKITLFICATVEAMSILGLTIFTDYLSVVVLTITYSIAKAPVNLFLDGLTAQFCEKSNIVYATIRMFGSIGYFTALMLGGIIADVFSFSILFIISLCIIQFAGVFALFLPVESSIKNVEKKEKLELFRIFKNKRILLILLINVIVFAIADSAESFRGLFFQDKGIATTYIGFITGFIILFETIGLALFGRLSKRLKLKYIVGVIFIGRILAYFFMGMNFRIGISVLFAIFGGMIGGFTLAINIKLITKFSKPKDISNTIFIIMIAGSLMHSIYNYLFGKIIDTFNVNYVYIFSSCAILIGSILVFVIFKTLNFSDKE